MSGTPTVYGWSNLQGFHKGFFVDIMPRIPQLPINGKVVTANVSMPTDLDNIVIRGKLTSDDTNLDTNWENTFEGANAESKTPMVAGLIQSGIASSVIDTNSLVGKTSISILESLQMYKGSEAQTLNLQLQFQAFDDPYIEVEAPLMALLKIASAELTNGIAVAAVRTLKDLLSGNSINQKFLGEVPLEVEIILNNKLYSGKRFVIQNISSSRDELRLYKDGNSVVREVNVTLKSKRALMRSDITL